MDNLKKQLSQLKEGQIILLETSAENSFNATCIAIEILTKKEFAGIILSSAKPCNTLIESFTKKKISTKKLFILDCVHGSKEINPDFKNVLHLSGASDLTSISIAINEAILSIPGKKFLLIDSIAIMLIYNKQEIFAKFMYSILAKLQTNKINGILISVTSSTDNKLRDQLAQMCNKVIKG